MQEMINFTARRSDCAARRSLRARRRRKPKITDLLISIKTRSRSYHEPQARRASRIWTNPEIPDFSAFLAATALSAYLLIASKINEKLPAALTR